MKIAVVGSHGTGKTTLCRGIAEIFKFKYIPDVVPDAFRLKFPINEETPPETQLWILSKQLELERNTPEPWIMEKSLWNNIIYGSFSIKDKEVLNVIKKIAIANARYDTIFYLPIEFPIPYDPLRSMNEDFQRTVDKRLRSLLRKFGIRYIELKGDMKTRLRKAEQVIRGTLSK